MFVNGIPFLVNFSLNIRFITCEYVPTRTAGRLAKSLMKIVKLYARGGFVICLVIMVMELENVKDKVGLLEVNTTASQEHAAKIERNIHLMKDRTQFSTSDMLYCGIKYLHKNISIHQVYNICLWLKIYWRNQGYPCNITQKR